MIFEKQLEWYSQLLQKRNMPISFLFVALSQKSVKYFRFRLSNSPFRIEAVMVKALQIDKLAEVCPVLPHTRNRGSRDVISFLESIQIGQQYKFTYVRLT